jgi:hypothetical protein
MIALTPQALKWAKFEFARNGFSQKSGKTKAPTIGLDGNATSSISLTTAPFSPPPFGDLGRLPQRRVTVLGTGNGVTAPGAFCRSADARFLVFSARTGLIGKDRKGSI